MGLFIQLILNLPSGKIKTIILVRAHCHLQHRGRPTQDLGKKGRDGLIFHWTSIHCRPPCVVFHGDTLAAQRMPAAAAHSVAYLLIARSASTIFTRETADARPAPPGRESNNIGPADPGLRLSARRLKKQKWMHSKTRSLDFFAVASFLADMYLR